jgi:hypothetical protein
VAGLEPGEVLFVSRLPDREPGAAHIFADEKGMLDGPSARTLVAGASIVSAMVSALAGFGHLAKTIAETVRGGVRMHPFLRRVRE